MPSLSRAQGTVSQQTKHNFISGKWWWSVIIPNNCAISEKGQPQTFQGNHTKATRERETPSKVGTPPGERSQNFSWPCLFSWPRSKPSSYPRVSPQMSDVYQTLSKKMLDAHLVVQSPAGANVFDISFLFTIWNGILDCDFLSKKGRKKQKILGAFPILQALKRHLIWSWSYEV